MKISSQIEPQDLFIQIGTRFNPNPSSPYANDYVVKNIDTNGVTAALEIEPQKLYFFDFIEMTDAKILN